MINADEELKRLSKRVAKRQGEAALLELLAEEAAELAQAALKLARINRGESPTPVDRDTAVDNVREELADISLVRTVLAQREQVIDRSFLCAEENARMLGKLERWAHRLGIELDN